MRAWSGPRPSPGCPPGAPGWSAWSPRRPPPRCSGPRAPWPASASCGPWPGRPATSGPTSWAAGQPVLVTMITSSVSPWLGMMPHSDHCTWVRAHSVTGPDSLGTGHTHSLASPLRHQNQFPWSQPPSPLCTIPGPMPGSASAPDPLQSPGPGRHQKATKREAKPASRVIWEYCWCCTERRGKCSLRSAWRGILLHHRIVMRRQQMPAPSHWCRCHVSRVSCVTTTYMSRDTCDLGMCPMSYRFSDLL